MKSGLLSVKAVAPALGSEGLCKASLCLDMVVSVKRKERKRFSLSGWHTGRTGILLGGDSSSPGDGRGLKRANPQSNSSAGGKGNFSAPPNRARTHPGTSTHTSPPPFPLLQETKLYKHLLLSHPPASGSGKGAVSWLQAGSWQIVLQTALTHMHLAPPATDEALLHQTEGGRDFQAPK